MWALALSLASTQEMAMCLLCHRAFLHQHNHPNIMRRYMPVFHKLETLRTQNRSWRYMRWGLEWDCSAVGCAKKNPEKQKSQWFIWEFVDFGVGCANDIVEFGHWGVPLHLLSWLNAGYLIKFGIHKVCYTVITTYWQNCTLHPINCSPGIFKSKSKLQVLFLWTITATDKLFLWTITATDKLFLRTITATYRPDWLHTLFLSKGILRNQVSGPWGLWLQEQGPKFSYIPYSRSPIQRWPPP